MSALYSIGLFTEHDVRTVRYLWQGVRQWWTGSFPVVPYPGVPAPRAADAGPVLGSLVFPYRSLDDSLKAMEEGRFGGTNELSSAELNRHLRDWEGEAAGRNMEVSFRDARFNVVELDAEVVLYRAGQKNRTMGQFFARAPPSKRFDVRFNSAVLTEWSSLDTVYEVRVPKGTVLFDGYIAPQGNAHIGLGQQIFVRKPWEIPGLEESARVVQTWGGDGRSMGTVEALVA